MPDAWVWTGVAIFVDGLAGLAGGLLSDRWLVRRQGLLVAFAAGALLGAAFLDVLPEAVERCGPRAFPLAFLAFTGFAGIEALAGGHHASRCLPTALLVADG